MEPLLGSAARAASPAVPATGAVFRYAIHVPSGQRVRLLIDPLGSVMSATAEVEPDAIAVPELVFSAIKFCEEYLARARNRGAN
jgi:hypothetical protein